MTPMEAWNIISANLAQLYRIRATQSKAFNGYPQYPGYDDADTEAEVMAFCALKEMNEKECATWAEDQQNKG